MAVISVSITASSEQIVAGIPKLVSITTNIPSLVFYTLDGSTPTMNSNQYVSPIFLAVDKLSVTLNVFASNGTDSSPIISEVYQTDMVDGGARLPHSPTDVPPGTSLQGLYPFGDNPIQPLGRYGNPADSGITVDNPALAQIPSGYNGDGYGTGFTNQPYNSQNYNIVYSTRNSEGESGQLVGNLPANVTIQNPTPPPETSQQFTSTFDPRAYVIFQDFSKEDPNDPQQINRQFFSLENNEAARDGNAYFNSGLDAPPVSGSFLRSHYNPRTNELTHYYLDTWTNKWIISTAPFKPTGSFDGNLASVARSNKPGSQYVYEWIPFARRVLF